MKKNQKWFFFIFLSVIYYINRFICFKKEETNVSV
nr:MAG TPA: hypothetical protein [Caudoviricetes sp.]